MENKESKVAFPQPFIQNYSNWCWVVAIKLVGMQYVLRKGSINDYLKDGKGHYYRSKNDIGIRENYVGKKADDYLIDGWQNEIAYYVSDKNNFRAKDEEKLLGLRYVVNKLGNNKTCSTGTLGNWMSSFSKKEIDTITEMLSQGLYLIANSIVLESGFAHTYVMFEQEGLTALYDPWDGRIYKLACQELFYAGFSTSLGTSVIRWIQYVS